MEDNLKAIIKPQYVDHIPKAVKGKVDEILATKDQRDLKEWAMTELQLNHVADRDIAVLSGGELPAAVLCDSIIRLIPGVLNNETSALTDSFQDNLLAPPVYTRPANYNNIKVPELLLSGNKSKIEDWREKKSIEKTKKIRPGLLK